MENIITKIKNGFTLAEVLITLVIIGVVAAMTIPTLVNNTKKQEYVAGLKKANSVLSQAVYKIGQNKGYPVGDYSFLNENNFIDEFAKVVSITKKCDTFTECFGKNPLGSENVYQTLDNSPADNSDGKSVITSDGQMFSFAKSLRVYGISQDDADNVIGRILVDINGNKNPNKYGYDLFFFYLIEHKGIVPAGSDSSSECNTTHQGVTCAAKVLRENAINY